MRINIIIISVISLIITYNMLIINRYGDVPMTFQSKDPIISMPMQEKTTKDKSSSISGGAGGGSHGLVVEHPTSYVL